VPRKSIEAVSAAAYRAGGRPPAPPSDLSTKAKQLWRRIAASRPPDYFCPAGQLLLASFCELQTTQAVNLQMLRREPTDAQWQKQAAAMQMVLNALAVKLKISPSGNLKRNAGIISEREVDTDDDGNVIRADLLFGGSQGAKF
jgi:hypothetical protein